MQDPSLREIAEAAARGDYERSETLSAEFVARQPGVALGWFYLGHARAARGRFAEAVEPLQKSVDLGLADPKARFQLGYAAHRAGRHELAVEALSAVLASLPGHEEARYCLGVSQLDLGRAATAEETLGPLAEVEGPWRFLALFHRGLARRRLGREKDATSDLRLVAEQAGAPELRAKARELTEVRPPAEPRRLSFLALLKAGHDSNVLLMPDTSVARGSKESAAFLISFASGEGDLTEGGDLKVRGSALDVRYDGVPGADLDALLSEVEGRTEWKEVGVARLSLHGDLIYLDHEPLFRRGGLEAALRRELRPDLHLEASGLLMVKDFRPGNLQAMDAVEAGVGLEAQWAALPETLELRMSYRFTQENADAGELDFRQHRGELRISAHPVPDWEARLDGWLARTDYEDPDPATLDGRHDRRRGLRLGAFWSARQDLQVFVEFEAERGGSTVDVFDYRRRVASLGASLSF